MPLFFHHKSRHYFWNFELNLCFIYNYLVIFNVSLSYVLPNYLTDLNLSFTMRTK